MPRYCFARQFDRAVGAIVMPAKAGIQLWVPSFPLSRERRRFPRRAEPLASFDEARVLSRPPMPTASPTADRDVPREVCWVVVSLLTLVGAWLRFHALGAESL